jgi:NAD(P)-dependent dehydrogenase (short-subunit alcohol dehydrogenase family)
MRLAGKTIVVTGAASGIGAATATLAEARGATVVRTDIRDKPAAGTSSTCPVPPA